MKGIPGPYWQKDLAMAAKIELSGFNLTSDDVEKVLSSLGLTVLEVSHWPTRKTRRQESREIGGIGYQYVIV
jgi:hypothetical protein